MMGEGSKKQGRPLVRGWGRSTWNTLEMDRVRVLFTVHSTSEASGLMQRVNVFLIPPRSQVRRLFRCLHPESSLLFLGWATGSTGTMWGPSESQESTLLVTVEEKDHRDLTEALGTADLAI